jgi:hypothetical protein
MNDKKDSIIPTCSWTAPPNYEQNYVLWKNVPDNAIEYEYFIVTSELAGKLFDSVMSYINNGWELFGTPFYGRNIYCQAIKRKKENK